VINLDVLAEKGAIAMKDRELFQFADTPQQAFDLLKAGLMDNPQVSSYEKEQMWAGEGVPQEPAPSAQDLLGPDIAKTR